MRTTITLDPDTEAAVRRRMAERGEPFKVAVNALIREGAFEREPFRTATASLGRSAVNLDRALTLAGELEDDDLIRRMREGN
jgi:hypothetical protein